MFNENIYNLLAFTEDGQEVEQPVEQETEVQEEQESSNDSSNTIDYDIDGDKFTKEQILEWKNSSMTSRDFLLQKQEIEKMKSENKDALELFGYLKNKPDLVKKLYELDSEAPKISSTNPYDGRIKELEDRFVYMGIERELEDISSKDKDVNKIELLNIATQNNCSVTNAYAIWRGNNLEKILEKRLQEQSKNITKNMKQNNAVTKTPISETDGNNDVKSTFGLTEQELLFANKLGMTPEEYKKWKV